MAKCIGEKPTIIIKIKISNKYKMRRITFLGRTDQIRILNLLRNMLLLSASLLL